MHMHTHAHMHITSQGMHIASQGMKHQYAAGRAYLAGARYTSCLQSITSSCWGHTHPSHLCCLLMAVHGALIEPHWGSCQFHWGSCQFHWGSCQSHWGSCQSHWGSCQSHSGSCQSHWGSCQSHWGSCQSQCRLAQHANSAAAWSQQCIGHPLPSHTCASSLRILTEPCSSY